MRAWPLNGGISAEIAALEYERADHQIVRIVVRRPGQAALRDNPHIAENEFRVLERLRAHGAAAPAPLAFLPAGELFDTAALVIEYVEGQMDLAPTDLDGFARQFAVHLSAIHGVNTGPGEDGQDLAFLARPEQAFAGQVLARPERLDASLWEARIRDVLEAAWPIPQRNPSALLHGDYWPGNVLWREGRLAAVIDWEDALFGDPLVDLAIARLDLQWILGPQAMATFTREYLDRRPIDLAGLPYWDLFAAMRLIRLAGADLPGWAAFFHPYGRTDITEATIRAHYRAFVEEAFRSASTGNRTPADPR